MADKNERASLDDREGLLGSSGGEESSPRNSNESLVTYTSSIVDEKEPKWWRTSAADRAGFRINRNGSISTKRICLGLFAGTIALVVIVVTGGVVYTKFFGPEKWESEGWFPSPMGGTVKSWEESYKKAAVMVGEMTLPEKVNITTGVGWSQGLCVGNTGPAINVGFPSLCLQDGPLGLRLVDYVTAWPAGLTAGATWNRELIKKRGALHAVEARGKGINVILGPSMGPLGRMPAGGRNWEGFGSDPYLQGIAAAATIEGIQSEGVIATAKHYIANEQEHFRKPYEWGLPSAISSNIDDRTMHELYLWPFADAVRAGVGSVMCSYQLANNTYTCGNSKLLNGLLKDELGFQGFVQSDWLAQRSGVDSILAGLDMTMPGDGAIWADGDSFMGHILTRAVLNSSIAVERLNDMATRIVATWYQMGQDDEKKFPATKEGPNFSSWTNEKEGLIYFGSGEGPRRVVNKYIDVQKDHYKVARQVAAEGTVVVKNDGSVLPLKRGVWVGKKVGIYGEDAGPGDGPNRCEDNSCNQGTLASGWGSGAVEFPYIIDPLSALSRSFNKSSDDLPVIDSILDNKALGKIEVSAKEQDLCFAFINADAGEGYLADLGVAGDRNDLFAQKGGDELVITVAKACKGDTIVVIHAVGAVIVDKWIDLPGVKAVVYAHLPGQESGNALVDILFGDVNPSGKLPYTIGKSTEDYGAGARVMYFPNGIAPQQTFSEGVFIDYRHFDKHDITPRYEFGFGLSYTSFEISDIHLTPRKEKSPLPSPRPDDDAVKPPKYKNSIPDVQEALYPDGFKKLNKYIYPYISSPSEIKKGAYPYPPDYTTHRKKSPAGGAEGGNPSLWDIIVDVEVTLKNVGSVKGQEVVQLYVQFPKDVTNYAGEAIEFPVRVLRGFEKVLVESGKEKKVVFEVRRKDLSFWDVRVGNWRMPCEGNFTFWVGNSSRNLPVHIEF